MSRGQFAPISTLYVFIFLVVLFFGVYLMTEFTGREISQSLESKESSNGKLILLNLLRQEIPEERLGEGLELGDTYYDFILAYDEEDFKLVFDGSLDEYRPKDIKNSEMFVGYGYVISLVKDPINIEDNVLACSSPNCFENRDACDSYVKIEDNYLCLVINTDRGFAEAVNRRPILY